MAGLWCLQRVGHSFSQSQQTQRIIDLAIERLAEFHSSLSPEQREKLVANALKYSANQQKPVSINIMEADGSCEICICDHAIGIVQEKIPPALRAILPGGQLLVTRKWWIWTWPVNLQNHSPGTWWYHQSNQYPGGRNYDKGKLSHLTRNSTLCDLHEIYGQSRAGIDILPLDVLNRAAEARK